MNQNQLAINTVSLKGALPEILAGSAAAGFQNVEFALGQIHAYLNDGHDLQAVAQLLKQHKLRCIGGFVCELQAFSDADAQRANRATLLDNARLLSELGGGATQARRAFQLQRRPPAAKRPRRRAGRASLILENRGWRLQRVFLHRDVLGRIVVAARSRRRAANVGQHGIFA